jgi:hypothetical protein
METPTTKTTTAAAPDHQILAAATAGVMRTHAPAALVNAPLTLVSAKLSANSTAQTVYLIGQVSPASSRQPRGGAEVGCRGTRQCKLRGVAEAHPPADGFDGTWDLVLQPGGRRLSVRSGSTTTTDLGPPRGSRRPAVGLSDGKDHRAPRPGVWGPPRSASVRRASQRKRQSRRLSSGPPRGAGRARRRQGV